MVFFLFSLLKSVMPRWKKKKALKTIDLSTFFFDFKIDILSVNNLFCENHKNEKTVRRLDPNIFWHMAHFFLIITTKKKQVTRGTENARRREGAPKSTRSHETAWNKLRKCQFFALQKNRLKSQPFTLFRPGPGPAGDFKFLYSI